MRTDARRLLSRGISLVELMVGIAVGLLVVAAATTMVTAQLGSTRQVLLETQLDQDLRTAAEVVTRELRRSGASVRDGFGLWFSVDQLQTSASAGRAPTLTPGDASDISIRYRRGPGEEGFGFKLENNTVKMLIPDGGAGVWQELTDPYSVKVTKFSIDTQRADTRGRPDNLEPHIIACPYLCPDGTTDCWPRATPQEYTLTIEGESLRDPTVKRTLRTSVAARSMTTSFTAFPGQQGQNNQACPTLPN
jgi:type II secretory pathway component PulJ